MDKLEISERMAKAIVEYLLKHNVVKVIPITTNYLTMNPYITKDYFEQYIREAILKFDKSREKCPKCGSIEVVLKYVSETYTEIRCKTCGYRVGDDWRE